MPHQQANILIIEDERETGEMFAEMVRLRGYQAHNTFGGRTALSMIAELQPDVILLDTMLPDLSGLEIIKQMHQDRTLADIPVIIISARNMPADVQAGLEAGAVAYLVKPIEFNDLIQAVEMVLHIKPQMAS